MARTPLSFGASGNEVQRLQKQLLDLGHRVVVDGNYTQKTAVVVSRLQAELGLSVTGEASVEFLDALDSLWKRKLSITVETPPIRMASFSPPVIHVVVISSNETADELDRCLCSFSTLFRSKAWALTLAGNDRVKVDAATQQLHSTVIGLGSTKVIHYSGDWVAGFNTAMADCRKNAACPTIYPIRACDVPLPALVHQVIPVMNSGNHLFMHCDWKDSADQVTPATHNSILYETVPVGSVLLNVSMLPPTTHDTFPGNFSANADVATWSFWYFSGIKMFPFSGWPVCKITRRPAGDDAMEWAAVRSKLYTSRWTTPKVSALMLTGKCRERLPLARVAVQCFLAQTWNNKELIIINHGIEPVLRSPDPRIREIIIERPPDMTLGDLRNLSIEESTGDWCIQWDDDDWHHPTRIKNSMSSVREDHITTFSWQVRCSMTDGHAFYDYFKAGQQMSVLFSRKTEARYAKLNVREDTQFMEWYGKKVIVVENPVTNVDCDPMQYVRFFHGRNIWHYEHVMRGSDGKNEPTAGLLNLTPHHADCMRSILDLYKHETGFSTELEPVRPPV